MENNNQYFLNRNTAVNRDFSDDKEEVKREYDMILFCHLRWEFVYQRPQHIISRLAQSHNILVVEEPIHFSPEEENDVYVRNVATNIDVLQPKVKSINDISLVLQKHLDKTNYSIGWFYSAAFVSVLDTFKFDTIIYDCMDELSLFKGAPQELIVQENKLLHVADIVFTGGKSLYEAKKKRHSKVFCFPSSVDESHFAKATTILDFPADITHIKNPIVGYFGVIDERIDLQLLSETAIRLPNVSFVMIGPLAKINERDLPILSNIYFLGMKTYDELPSYLGAFDIAMMPFALNDSTKFISPTKTLEYMAAQKPIISTKIKDVVRDYSSCISLIETSDDFCDAITNSKMDLNDVLHEYKDILFNTSWDSTVERMNAIIEKNVLV